MYETTYHRPAPSTKRRSSSPAHRKPRYLAGGHTLIPVMKQRLASPSDVIDLGKIKELIGIEVSGDTVTIGGDDALRRGNQRTRSRRRSRRSPISPR